MTNSVFKGEFKSILANVDKAKSSSNNAQVVGRNGELLLSDFLNKYLPNTLKAVSGHFMSPNGKRSPHIDCMIIDTRYPLLAYNSDDSVQVMGHSVLKILEVKTNMTSADIKKSAQNFATSIDLLNGIWTGKLVDWKKPSFNLVAYRSTIKNDSIIKHYFSGALSLCRRRLPASGAGPAAAGDRQFQFPPIRSGGAVAGAATGFPRGGPSGSALLAGAECRPRGGRGELFAEVVTRLIDTAPQERRSQEALYLLAQTAADEADPVRAQAYLGRLLQEYPKGGWTDVALWLQGWLAYKQRQFPTALNAWGRLLADEPGSRWRVPALYWRGRVFEAMKRTAEATQTYRTLLDGATDQFYYRLRAGERLAALSRKPHAKTGPPESRPVPAGAANGLHAQKARALRGLGLTDVTVEEWSEQVRSRPEDRAGLAEACGVFQDLRRYEKAIGGT